MELKSFCARELKADTRKRTVVGYASVFGNVDAYGDIVVPGSFAQTIKERGPGCVPSTAEGIPGCKIKVLRNHDQLIGTPVHLKEDNYGLETVSYIAPTALGDDTLTLIEAGVLHELSIGYSTVQSTYNPDTNIRYLKRLELFEYSFVDFPANEQARVTEIRSAIREVLHRPKQFHVNADLKAAVQRVSDAAESRAAHFKCEESDTLSVVRAELLQIRQMLTGVAPELASDIGPWMTAYGLPDRPDEEEGEDTPDYESCGARDLPLADPELEFSYGPALDRVLAWAGGPDLFQPDSLAMAFMACNRRRKKEAPHYRFLFCDVQEGKLVAVPAALREIRMAIGVERKAPVSLFPEEVLTAAEALIDHYLGSEAKSWKQILADYGNSIDAVPTGEIPLLEVG